MPNYNSIEGNVLFPTIDGYDMHKAGDMALYLAHCDFYPFKSVIDNNKMAIDLVTKAYRDMAQEAREEGFDHIADLFEGVAKIEKEHEERYKKLLENLENGLVFSKDGDKIWKCRNCGHICVGKEAPEVCPVCAHPKAYFEIKAENY